MKKRIHSKKKPTRVVFGISIAIPNNKEKQQEIIDILEKHPEELWTEPDRNQPEKYFTNTCSILREKSKLIKEKYNIIDDFYIILSLTTGPGEADIPFGYVTDDGFNLNIFGVELISHSFPIIYQGMIEFFKTLEKEEENITWN